MHVYDGKMNIGIIGNRKGWTYEFVRKKLKELNVYKSDVIISGGADGIDTFAQRYAKEIGAQIIIIYSDPDKPIPQRYFDRNKLIILRSDIIVTFDKKELTHSGTRYGINFAKKQKKEVFVIDKQE